MRDHQAVRSEGLLDTFWRIVGNERGEVAVGGDIPRGDAPVEDSPEVTTDVETTEAPVNETPETPQSPETPVEEDPRDVEIRSLREQMEELSKRFEPKGEEQPKKEDAPALTWENMNPEQRSQAFRSFGLHVSQRTGEDGKPYQEVNIDPKAMIDGIIQRVSMAVQMANKYTDEMVHGNVSGIRFESELAVMEKKAGFADVRQYSEAIRKFLSENFQPKDHANPKFIETAYFWAKGKNLKNIVKKVIQNQDRSKTIVKPSSGAAPRPAVKGRLTPETMSEEQKRIAEATFRSYKPEVAWKKYADLY